MSRFCAVLVLALVWVAGAAADPPSPNDGWDQVITDLRKSSADLGQNDQLLNELQAENEKLKTIEKGSAAEIAQLKVLIEAHSQRVKDLGDRYGKVLVLAQKLKKDAENAAVLNYVFGGVALVAIAVAAGEGFALANR